MRNILRTTAVMLALTAVVLVGIHMLDLHPFVERAASASDFALAMAVVTKYGNGYKNPASLLAIDAVFAEGAARRITSKIDITNGDSIASKFYIGSVPSNAIIDPRSSYYYGAVTSVSDFDVGFENDPDALVDGDDVSSAGSQSLIGHGTLTLANGTKKAWELAGYTSDPGGMLAVFGTLKVAATATASILFVIDYAKK